MSTFTDNFVRLCTIFAAIDLFGDGPPEVPWGEDQPSADELVAAVSGPGRLLPLVYRAGYVDPLVAQAPSLAAQTDHRLSPIVLEALAGAVYDHDPARGVRPQLHRFLATISDLYRSFFSQQKRKQIEIPFVAQLPPLAVYQSTGAQGPFTLPADTIARILGSDVGVVSLPSTYRDHPVLWASLTHETGGHDITHAEPGLLPELAGQIRRMFGVPSAMTSELTPTQLQGLVWSYWIDQASADIYGTLNAGPAAVFVESALFSAMNTRKHPGLPVPYLRARSRANAAGWLDPHPTDLLRLPLAMGIVENLTELGEGARARYLGQLAELETACAHGATELELHGTVPFDAHTRVQLDETVPLAAFREAARRVGALVVTAKLASLGGHSIQEIETWSDADEAVAQRIRAAFVKDESVAAAGNDAQLLAGAGLALLEDPGLYTQVTARLEEGLDESFASDPLWGRVLLDQVYV